MKKCIPFPYLLGKSKKKFYNETLELAIKLLPNAFHWDLLDAITSCFLSYYFRDGKISKELVRAWSENENFWIRRASILIQLKCKDKTDEQFLFEICKKLACEKEFFIRKAIGWALREYSYFSPESVKKFVAETNLSPLSQRESLKVINKSASKKGLF